MAMLGLTFINIAYVVHVIYANEGGPSFIYQPATKVPCTEGTECMLVCSIKNLGSRKLEWQRNNVFVSSLNREHKGKYVETKMPSSGGSTELLQNSLIIYNVDRDDAKSLYRCVAKIGEKMIYSSNGTIELTEVPPSHYPTCSSKQTYSVGDIAKLTCISEKTKNTKVTLHWFHNNRLVENAKNSLKGNKVVSELTVRVTANDKGSTFKCKQELDTIQLNKTCTVGPLDITFGPEISISGPPSIPLYGEALYVCSNKANPPTTVNEWVEPQLPTEAYRLENHRQVLRILRATLNMNGTLLRCLAVNSIGREEKAYTLIIKSMKGGEGPIPTSQHVESTLQVTPDVSKILSVAGMCLLLTAVLIGLLLCYLQFCKFGLFPITTNEERIAQPEVYFEPKDNIRCMMSPYDDNGMYYKRNVAIQVTPGVDTDSVYAEVEEGKKT